MSDDFNPDWTVRPGAPLREWMEEKNIDTAELAFICDLTPETITGIFDASVEITEAIADCLETGTQITARFWLNFERRYREDLAAGRKDTDA